MPQFLKQGARGPFVDTMAPSTIDEILDTIEVPPSLAITTWKNRGFGIKSPTLRVYETLTLYYENSPSPVTREDIKHVAEQWKSYMAENLLRIPQAAGSLLVAVWNWLDENTDDVNDELIDAIELFQRREKLGPYKRK